MNEVRAARLFTTAGIGNDAQASGRASEILLAVLAMVPSYAATLLRAAGVRVDDRRGPISAAANPASR